VIDLPVVLSRRENFRMAAVEAMVTSLPIIISNKVGITCEFHKPQIEYAIYVDTNELENTWIKMLILPEDRVQMG